MIGPEGFSDSPEDALDSESCGDCIVMVGKWSRRELIDVWVMAVIIVTIICPFISALPHDMVASVVRNPRRKH